jgi:hypothetical protein
MNFLRVTLLILALTVVIGGCSQQEDLNAPERETIVTGFDKNGTEFLGEIAISAGSGFAEGGVGMVGIDSGILEITVPVFATVEQVLLYWVGGTTSDDGDSSIMINGIDINGELIGGGDEFFFDNYTFYGYRADLTTRGLVNPGLNSFTISGFDFDFSGGTLDENNGAGMIVIYDDGTMADLQLFDGLDMAFFKFSPDLDATEPVTFEFLAEPAARVGSLVVQAGSVGADRPNLITVTTSAGVQEFNDSLGSTDGTLFDSITLQVDIPAGATEATVQLFSVVSEAPLGASLGWLGSGLSVPVTPPPATYCIGDRVWFDENSNGCQDDGEAGVEGVTVNLFGGCDLTTFITSTVTGTDGAYEFCDLMPGDYTVEFVSPDGYLFCEQFSAQCGTELDSNAGSDGMTDCITIVDADNFTIDAGLCMPPEDCGDCDGKITELSLRYLGDTEAFIQVYMKQGNRNNGLLFEGTVGANEVFSFVGTDRKGTMGPNITLYVDETHNVDIHTSCSELLYIGLIKGDFEITAGQSRNGGNLCAMEASNY